MERKCKSKGCENKAVTKIGYCLKHYKRWKKYKTDKLPKREKKDVNIVIEKPLPVLYVQDTINLGKDMVMLYNQKEILKGEIKIKKNLIQEKMEWKSTKKLWRITLNENLNKEKLYIILTWIKKTIASQTSTYAKIEKNIIGVIIHLKKLEQNYIKEELLGLEMANILSISDTQRYKCLGNAVTVNVIEAIMTRWLVK